MAFTENDINGRNSIYWSQRYKVIIIIIIIHPPNKNGEIRHTTLCHFFALQVTQGKPFPTAAHSLHWTPSCNLA